MSDDEVERDSAPAGDAVVEAEDSGEEDWSPFDEIQEDFKPGPVMKVTAADGLPTNAHPYTESDIPVLSPETLTCMGDFSKFVVRDKRWGHVLSEWSPEHVERTPNGKYRALCATMSAPAVKTDPESIDEFGYMEVEPVRPPCRHYARQLTQFDLNAHAKVMLRVCAARRTTEGAFMSLRDRAMWACELREPQVEARSALDEFDARKMQEGANREYVPMFQGTGIFGGDHGGK